MGILSVIIGILAFFLILGLIVLVHEAGHLIVAKRNGVYCHEFSIGMGPKIIQIKQDKTGTVYNLRVIPLGGYVRLAGEDTGIEEDKNIAPEKKFDHQTRWVKFKILVAGAMMNFLLAIIILPISGFLLGYNPPGTINVAPNSPFAESGIQTGDKILTIDDNPNDKTKPVDITSYVSIIQYIENKKTNTITIEYYDQSENKNKEATINKSSEQKYGIAGQYVEKYNLIGAIKSSFNQLINSFLQIVVTFQMLFFTHEAGVNDLSGPIGIATVTVQLSSLGLRFIIWWLAFLSINIGIMNLLPIPALDGGRIMFLIIEVIYQYIIKIINKITKKQYSEKLNPAIEGYANTVVFILLMGLMVYVTFNDILRTF